MSQEGPSNKEPSLERNGPHREGNIVFTTELEDDPPYSAFSSRQKGVIVFMIAIAAMFSPLSSFIYYPAITTLAHDLEVSVEKANLGITTYMIVSGIAPAIVADMADRLGRRPTYIAALTIYFAANIGLALQRNYAALLILRMVQSAGSSGVISLAYGVVADIAPRAERGSYVGAVLLGPNAAPSLGPVIGGILAHFAGWEWIFWFLTIVSGIVVIALVAYLPETARAVVGNGNVSAQQMNFTPLCLHREKNVQRYSHLESRCKRLIFPNPTTCLKVLCRADSAIVILVNGIFYMTYCSVQATLSSLFITIYGLNELEAGLVYLPFGFGCVLGSFCFGKLMNYDFARTSKAAGMSNTLTHDLEAFPIELARLRSIWWPLLISIAVFAGYGWALVTETSMVIPLILQFLLGAMITGIFNMCGTLLTDLHTKAPSTAQAALNLVRCALAAGGTAVIQLSFLSVGFGWTFTIIAGICSTTIPLILAELQFGPKLRSKRALQHQ